MKNKPIKYMSCYYEEGKIEENESPFGYVILIFFFWMIPILGIGMLIRRWFRSSFWITEKEYYEIKLKE